MILKRGLLILCLFTGIYGCSGDEQAEEPVEGESAKADGGGEGEDGGSSTPQESAAPEPAPEPEPAPPPPPPPPPPMPTEPAGFEGAAVTRYVTSYALNVRTSPDKTAPIKRHIRHGDKVDCVISGEWCKIGPSQYVSTKALGTTKPKPLKWDKSKAKK